MKTEVFLVRHGETEANLLGQLHGRTDLPLTESGFRQAECVARRLADLTGIGHIYTSPLVRARVTAEIIGRRLGLPPRTRHGLAEFDFGDLEGYTLQQFAQEYPELYARILHVQDLDVVFPNGESPRMFHQRVRGEIEHLIGSHRGDRLVVVAHGGVIGSAIAQLTGGDPNDWVRYQVHNCSVTHLEVSPEGKVTLHCWNDVSHLELE